MNRSIKETLSDKRGVVEGLGAISIALVLILAVGVIVTNYGLTSKKASDQITLTQEVSNRAELYASELNVDLLNPRVPAMTRSCSVTPAVCTTIVSATPAADGNSTVLRVQADMATALGNTITRDVTLVKAESTHVTAIDAQGYKTWALSDEGLRYSTWSVAEGRPKEITAEDIASPEQGVTWLSVDDRAGIDSSGALWVWGANDIGQAGTGSTSSDPIQPTKLNVPGVTFRSVVTEDDRAYAIDSKGAAWSWGYNGDGALGLGHRSNALKPTKVDGLRFTSFAIGYKNVFGITTSGELVAAGADQRGLYTGMGANFTVLEEGTRFKSVAASVKNNGMALIRADGTLVVNGSRGIAPVGVQFSSVARGADTGYAISTDGTLYSWGNGAHGQLGQRGTEAIGTATKVAGNTKFVSVQGTRTGAVAIDVNGTLHYAGRVTTVESLNGSLPRVDVFTPIMPEVKFRQIISNDSDSATALLDTSGNLYALGTSTPGLWPIDYSGSNDRVIRMPFPAGFSSNTWK